MRIGPTLAGAGAIALGGAFEIVEYMQGGWPSGSGFLVMGVGAPVLIVGLVLPPSRRSGPTGFDVLPPDRDHGNENGE